jgi:hypothetical protein
MRFAFLNFSADEALTSVGGVGVNDVLLRMPMYAAIGTQLLIAAADFVRYVYTNSESWQNKAEPLVDRVKSIDFLSETSLAVSTAIYSAILFAIYCYAAFIMVRAF